MKNIFPLIVILVFGLLSCTQDISPEQAEKFIKFYGNAFMDEARDVAILDDGSYAICGVDSIPGEGKRAVLILTDAYGNVKSGFPAYYSINGNNTAANAMVLEQGGEGGILLVGYEEVPVADSIQKDIFLVRARKSGTEMWKRSFGTAEDESILHADKIFASDVEAMPFTGYILAGYQIEDGKSDILVMGVDDQGMEIDLGLNYFSADIENAAANFIYTTEENYLVACTYDKVGGHGTDVLVLVVTADLSAQAEFLGGDNDEIGKCIEQVEDDAFLVLGTRENDSGFKEIIIHRIEIELNRVERADLVATISDAGADLDARRIKQMADGSYAIVGTREAEGNQDVFVQFLGSDFSIGMRKAFAAGGNQRGADLDFPQEGGMLILGTNGDESSSMISLIKTGDEGEL